MRTGGDAKKFGQMIKDERMASGMSLRAFAAKLSVSPSYLSKVENGNVQTPTYDMVVKMANELNYGPDYLLLEAGHIPADIREAIRRNPIVLSELIRAVAGLSYTKIQLLIEEARKMKLQQPPTVSPGAPGREGER